MMDEREALTLENICKGGVPEVFGHELARVLENMNDPSTEAEAVREITIKFKFKPFPDRSGASIKFKCSSKIVPVEEAGGQMFVQRRGTSFVAIPHDPKQARMFDGKTAATGERKEIQ
jgi:hypothetical protein